MADFSFTEEQDDLRREARAFLEANASPSIDQLRELGWVGVLPSSSSEGSDGFTFIDAAVLFEELGRVLYDGPYVFNEVAGQPGDDVWSIEIDGFVPHLEQVGRVLTPSMQGSPAVGETLATVDETLGLGRLAPDGSEAAIGTWPEVRRRLLAALALEAVGIGTRAVEIAIAYASEREQFGKKIGTYQAISHSLVDAYVAVELGRSLAYWAAWCVAEGDEQAEQACAAAKSQAAEAAVLACEKAIQALGGIGFTWEHPLHRYYKRALWIEGALGYGREHRAEVAAFLLRS
jgi:alkylation response protein AidB-like acyl-CoA dehydrogenase